MRMSIDKCDLFGNSTNTLTWGSTAGFVGAAGELQFGSNTADSLVNFNNNLDLNTTTNRSIRLFDNAAVATDMAAITGVISGSGGLNLIGPGSARLILSGSNTYAGGTTISGVDLVLRNPSALGTGATITFSTGLLDVDTMSLTLINSVILRGSIGLTGTGGNSITLAGNISLSTNSQITSSNLSASSVLSGSSIFLGIDSTARTLTLAAVSGGTITVEGLRRRALQGDVGFVVDTTALMGPAIQALKSGMNDLVTSLHGAIPDLGINTPQIAPGTSLSVKLKMSKFSATRLGSDERGIEATFC